MTTTHAAEHHQCARCNRPGAEFPVTLVLSMGRVERHRVCKACYQRTGQWLRGWVEKITFMETAP